MDFRIGAIQIFYYLNKFLPNFIKINALKLSNYFLHKKEDICSSRIYSYIFSPMYSVMYNERTDEYQSLSKLNILGETDRGLYCSKKNSSYVVIEQIIKNDERLVLVEDESLYRNVLQLLGYGKKIFNESLLTISLPFSERVMIVSKVRFISIEYTHPKLTGHLIIKIPDEYLFEGNQILSPLFVCRYLAYNYGTHVFFEDMNYTLTIIDNYLNIFTLNKEQKITLGKEEYEINHRKNPDTDTIVMSKNSSTKRKKNN